MEVLGQPDGSSRRKWGLCCRGRLQGAISGREEERAAEYALHSGRPAGSGQRGLGGGPPPWSVEERKAEAMLQRKGGLLGGLLMRGRPEAGPIGVWVIPPASQSLPWELWLTGTSPRPRGSTLPRTGWHCTWWDGKSEGRSPASPETQNKHFLLGSLKAAKGLWPDNPPVFPGAFGALGWAGHFLIWEEALGGRAQL